jgi:hypothetical protein
MSSTRPFLAVLSLALALPALGAARSREVAPRTVPLAADGTLSIETYKGKVEIVAPRTAAFTLDAEADRGEVDTRGFAVTSESKGRRHRGESAHGDVNGGGPRVHLATNKGTVRLSAR